MMRNIKKGAADLLLELVFSTIIFFIIVAFLFGVKGPSLRINANANVVSAETSFSCDISLANLLRSPSPNGLTYSEWLSYTDANDDNWKGNVSALLNSVFGENNYNLTVYDLSQQKFSIGKYNSKGKVENKEFIRCLAYVPLKANVLLANCNWSQTEEGKKPNDKISFSSPDGSCNVTLENTGYIGITSSEGCEIVSKQTKLEDLDHTLDSIEVDLTIGSNPYTLFITETNESKNEMNVTLSKRAKISECSYLVTLTIANINVLKEMQAAQEGK